MIRQALPRVPTVSLLASACLWPAVAQAGSAAVATTRAGGGQPALTVGFDPRGDLVAVACAQSPCALDMGTAIAMPEPARKRYRDAKLAVVPIGLKRSVVWVRVPMPEPERAWEAIVTTVPGSKETKILFADWTGWVAGEYGLRRGAMVQVSPSGADGVYRILLGEQREDVSVCGRPTVLAPQLLTAEDLAFHPAKVQRLSAKERAAARRVIAERIVEPAVEEQGESTAEDGAAAAVPKEKSTPTPLAAPVLVRAMAASSAVGLPGALTDGDPTTSWAENRGGAGRGEFVVMTASSSLPLHAFELVIRSKEEAPAHGTAPREFWLASDHSLWLVTMPEDAWNYPGARYRISLEQPMQTGCLALVTESAWNEHKDAQVTFAELAAVSEFDVGSIAGLVGALAGGGERAKAAAALLSASGEQAHREVASRFESLDEQGRRAALDVLDSADCKISSPAYVKALLGAHRAHRAHAKERLLRCGQRAASALEAALGATVSPRDPLLLAQLALATPQRAVPEIVRRLKGNRRRRRLLRDALSLAVRSSEGLEGVEHALRGNPPSSAVLDVLRAVGPSIGEIRVVAEAQLKRFARDDSFRVRYLLLEPAGRLASSNSSPARKLIARALVGDPNPHVRTRAAQVIRGISHYRAELIGALRDSDVRVREAALGALANRDATFALPLMIERMRDDAWPLVRKAAAAALSELPADPGLDSALGESLRDESPVVQAAAIHSLGARRARGIAPEILELLQEEETDTGVRRAAAKAMGRLCFEGAVDELTRAVHKLIDPMAEQEAWELGWVSLEALGRIGPRDLKSRLAPLMSQQAPRRVRQVAQRMLGKRGACRLSPTPARKQ